jgi:acyl-CoA thioesterase I
MSFIVPADLRSSACARGRSYGCRRAWRQILRAATVAAVCSIAVIAATIIAIAGATKPVKVVALGDSLTAGYGLPESDGFVPRLQAALAAKGVAAVIDDGGVSGDTAADGLARLDWSVPPGTEAVILELGANDMLRGLDPKATRAALDAILHRLSERHIAVLICGMRAAPNLGAEYGKAFEGIYPELAAKYGVPLYPFFLGGVAGDLRLTQRDGVHPTAAGVAVIVDRILPYVEGLIAHIRPAQILGSPIRVLRHS